jgi:hypothetical protein
MGLDTNCDGADGIVGTDVYVDLRGGQDTSDGSPKAPLRSLTKALAIASARGGHILVAAGQVESDSLPLSGTWSLFGGYDLSFSGPPDRRNTVFAASAAGLLVDGSTASGRLVHVTVKGAAPEIGSQQLSAHALRSEAVKIALDDVVLQTADGASGQSGTDGAPGASDNSGTCGAASEPDFALGQRYNRAAPDGTPPATIGPSGGMPATQAGAANDGTDGTDAASAIRFQDGLVIGSSAAPGLSNGTPGYGGAGGGSATSWRGTYEIWGGRGGNGGCPGVGGAAGQTGGSAVALVVLAGAVEITRSELHVGFGGAGGDGGQGGAGGVGAPGLSPELVYPKWPAVLKPSCTNAVDDAMALNCAEYGGQGGAGGAGGHGGGGAGGWSIGVLLAPGAASHTDSATSVALKKAGAGGAGGGASAPSGRSVESYALNP